MITATKHQYPYSPASKELLLDTLTHLLPRKRARPELVQGFLSLLASQEGRQ